MWVWHVRTSRSCDNVGVAHGKEIRMHSVHGTVEMVRCGCGMLKGNLLYFPRKLEATISGTFHHDLL